MRFSFHFFLASLTLFTSGLAQAGEEALEKTFKAFTHCDEQFFSSLHANAGAWELIAPLKHSEHAAWIAVKNRSEEKSSEVTLNNAPVLADVKLLSYFDQSSDLGSLGYYLYWGFIVDGQPEQVARKLSPLIADHERLQRTGPTEFVRSELRVGNNWQASKPRPGQAPGVQRLERVLLIEPADAHGERTRVSCSLQGAVDGALLAQMRPDVSASEYPHRPPVPTFDSVAVPDGLREGVESQLLRPKFKFLRYTYVLKKSNDKPVSPVSIEMEANGGLIHKTEIYSKDFRVNRLTQADLIQIKSKLNGVGDGRVLVTRSVDASIPLGWILGREIKVRALMDYVPAKAEDEPVESELICKIGQRVLAHQIFASLNGDAIRLECVQGNYRTSRVFIEDLGVALILESTSDSGRMLYEITNLEVER